MVSPTILSRPEISHLNTPQVSPGLQHVTNKAVVMLYHRKPSEHLYHCLNTSHFGSHIVPSMATEMQPRTESVWPCRRCCEAGSTITTQATDYRHEFPGIGPRDKASQHVLLPLDCGVHEKSTRACPMMQVMSMLPTSLFFKLTCWKYFLYGRIELKGANIFTRNTITNLTNCPQNSAQPTRFKTQNLNTKSPPPKRPHQNQIEPWTLPREIRSATGMS